MTKSIKHLLFFLIFTSSLLTNAAGEHGRTTIKLNGTWQFDQTENAFPPVSFTRTIPSAAGSSKSDRLKNTAISM